MKKIFIISVIFLTCLFYFNENCTAQWQSDVRLNNDPSVSYTSYNNGRSIAVKGDTVIVFWMTQVSGWWSIYSKRSFNGGGTWLDSVEVRHAGGVHYTSPAAAYSNNRFYVVYIGHVTAINQYYVDMNLSTDAGTTWNQKTVMTNDEFIKDKPSIAVDSNYVHVAFWIYNSSSSYLIKYRRSTNFGSSFGDETSWTSISYLYENPSITSRGSNIMLTYQESMTGDHKIIFRSSTNNGQVWSGYQTLASGADSRGFPSIASSGSYVYIFWQDSKYGNSDILSRRSSDYGASWVGEVRLTSHSSNQYRPNVYSAGTFIHAVWEDDRDSTEIYYIRSTNNGSAWQAVQQLTDNPYSSLKPSVIASGTKVHVCWSDRRTGNYDVYYKRNPTGNVGIQNINSEIPKEYKLFQNYPNPFNSMTNVKFQISNSGNVKIIVFGLPGKEIATLVNEQLAPGTYSVDFDASQLPSGVYFYLLEAGNYIQTRKMILLK